MADDSLSPASPWLVLAHLLRPQGRRGEILADLLTDFPERFTEGARIFLAPPNFSGPPEDARALTVANHWLPVGRNHGRIVLHFHTIDTIEDAEALASLDVLVPAEERTPIDDDAEYIDDLIGCTVYDTAPNSAPNSAQPSPQPIGQVTAVDFPTTPDGSRRLPDAAPLLTILTPADEEILIPFVQAFLIHIDTPNRRIDMQLPPGLLDLNRPTSNH